MDTKALRQKILDLAIRGKLVPQDPNDEPASVLLERIRERKQQMIKEGKLKKKDIKNDSVIFVGEDNLHYEKFADGSVKCIEDEIPFELPEGWAWLRLQTFVNFIGGSQPPKSTFEYTPTADNIRLIQIRDYKTDKFITYIPRSKARRFCNKDDVMIGRYGPPIFQILRGLEGSYNVALMKAVANPDLMLNDYLYYLLQDGELLRMLESLSDRTCGQDGISMYELNRYIVGIPPIHEQQRIVKYLIDILPKVDAMTKSREELAELVSLAKSKILDLAIRGQLVPQNPDDEPASVLLERIRAEKKELIKQGKIKRNKKESIIFKDEDNSYYEKFSDGKCRCIEDDLPFELPTGWEYERLGNICSVARGGSPRPIETYLTNDDNGLNWIKIGDTEQGGKYIYSTKEKIRPEGLVKTRYVQNGDFLLTNSMSFGRPYILKTDGCIHDGWLVIGNTNVIFNQNYLYYLLSSTTMYNELSALAVGSTVKNLKSDSVKSLLVPIPPLKEQETIATRIESLFNTILFIEKSLS